MCDRKWGAGSGVRKVESSTNIYVESRKGTKKPSGPKDMDTKRERGETAPMIQTDLCVFELFPLRNLINGHQGKG